ncbi:hypothetical protein H6B10_17500, partial [Gemmiger formicilis]|nr:hypothetical protein [Gemmiger formicilis]
MNLQGRDFLTLLDYTPEEISGLLDLRTVPSAVGGDEEKRHGVVLAKSGPAKAFGVRTGE